MSSRFPAWRYCQSALFSLAGENIPNYSSIFLYVFSSSSASLHLRHKIAISQRRGGRCGVLSLLTHFKRRHTHTHTGAAVLQIKKMVIASFSVHLRAGGETNLAVTPRRNDGNVISYYLSQLCQVWFLETKMVDFPTFFLN